ncbi:MAG: hypothetical protein LCH38_12140 [Proteobacteria bacterium]|nr:hypothetical protein [Pseudomonadota bacterium]
MAVYRDTSMPLLAPTVLGIQGNLSATSASAQRNTWNLSKGNVRYAVWLNIVTIGLNAGVVLNHISMAPNGNNWRGGPTRDFEKGTSLAFTFMLGNIPVMVYLEPAYVGVLSVHVAFWPTENAWNLIRPAQGGFDVGEIFASGWFERVGGPRLHSPQPIGRVFELHCRKRLLQMFAELYVKPHGFERADHCFR